MHNLTSTKMIELFDEEYPKIMDATEGKDEYARLHEAFYRGLLHNYLRASWHDVNVEPIPFGKVVWVRVIHGEFDDYPVYATNVDDFEELFPNGYRITHWQEIIPFAAEEENGLYHVNE